MSTAPPPPEDPAEGPPEDAPEDGAGPPPPPARRRRRAWRRVAVLLPLFLLTGLVLAIVELPLLLPAETIRAELVAAVTEATGAEFEIRALRYDPLSGLTAEGVRLGPPPGFERDVFSAERLHVAYDVTGAWDRKVRVEAVELDDPVFVLETRRGKSNLDAILEAVARKYLPSEPSTEAPTVGPLLPVDIVLDGLRIGPFAFELAGEGPTGRVSQVWLQASGEAGRETLDVTARLETKAEEGPGLSLDVPATAQSERVQAGGDLGLALDVHAVADTRRGLAVKSLDVDLRLAPRVSVALGAEVLPPLALDLAAKLSATPPEDRVRLAPLTLRLQGEEVLESQFELTGLVAALDEQLGPIGSAAISSAVGLSGGAERPELVAEVSRLLVPLDAVSPYAEIFERGASVSGRVGVRDLRVVGAPSALIEGRPDEIEAQVAFEEVKAWLPRRDLRLGKLDGALELARDPEAGDFTLAGALDLARWVVPGLTVDGGAVDVDGRVPRLGYPLPGPADLGVTVALRGVGAPGVQVEAVRLSARVAGDDLLSEARAGLAPVQVTLGVEARGIEARTGTVAPYRVATARVSMGLEPQRLLTAATTPIPLSLDATLGGVSGPDRLTADGVTLTGQGALEDPRRALPCALQLAVELRAASLNHSDYEVDGVRLRLDASTPSEVAIGEGPLAGIELPARVRSKVRLDVQRVLGRGAMQGLDTGASLAFDLRAQPASGRGRIVGLKARLDDALALDGELSVRRGFSPRPRATLALDLDKAALGPLLARLPTAYLGGFADARAEGQMKASLRFEGQPHHLAQSLDLRSAPVKLELTVGFDEAGVSSEARRLGLSGLGGTISMRLGPDGAAFDNELAAARFTAGAGEDAQSILGATLVQHLGYGDGEWAVQSRVAVERVEGAMQGSGEVEGLSTELLARYPTGGDLQIPRLTLRARSAGVDVEAQGSLRRGAFGVFVPDLDADAWVDFDRLRALWPDLGELSGRAQTTLSLKAPDAQHLEVEGALSLASFGFVDRGTRIEDASGRVPIAQVLELPPAAFDGEVAAAVGALGDDLEARIEEMQARFRSAKGLFSTQDVVLVPPRHADHEALRPYRRARGPDLRARKVEVGQYVLEAVVAEAHWREGMLRLDHFEAELWDGDLLTDMVVQLTPDLDLKARIRGTVTNLNLDIPYVVAAGGDASEAAQGDEFATSATMDLSFALKTRTLNGQVEITKLSQALVQRLFGGLALSGGGGALKALSWSERVGVRPVAAKVWIAQNLLNVQFDWRRLWLHVYYDSWAPWMIFFDTALIFARPALIPTLGGLYVIPTVNGAIYRLSLSGFLDPIFEQYQPEARLQALAPHVAAAGEPPAP